MTKRLSVLISACKLLSICLGLFLLENVGVAVYTCTKPINVLAFFALSDWVHGGCHIQYVCRDPHLALTLQHNGHRTCEDLNA